MNNISLDDVLSKIRDADDTEISMVIKAVIQRYAAAFPDCETIFLTLPKYDSEERSRILDWISDFLRHQRQL